MFTAEFEAKVEDGKIAIPDEYKSAFGKTSKHKGHLGESQQGYTC